MNKLSRGLTWLLIVSVLGAVSTDAENGPNASTPPAASEIVRRYVDGVGGAVRWNEQQSLVLDGTMKIKSAVSKVEIRIRKPDKFLIKSELADTVLSAGFNGQVGWQQKRGGAAYKMQPIEIKMLRDRLQFYLGVTNQLRGIEKEITVRTEVVSGQKYSVLTLTQAEVKRSYYFAEDSGLLVRMITSDNSGIDNSAIEVSQYQRVGGVAYPMRTTTYEKAVEMMQISIDQIKEWSNDDTIFEMPRRSEVRQEQ
jgi:hypothetical protein